MARWVATLAVLFTGCAASTALAQHGEPTGISVVGIGRAIVRPDVAVADVGADARAPRMADATADVDRRMRAVLAALQQLGVGERDVQTVRYTVEPVLARPRPGEDPAGAAITGYRVENVVRVRVRDLATAGRVLDAALGAGANVTRNLHFAIDDPARGEAEARARAVRDATERARQLAAAAGVRLGPLVSLVEGGPVRPLGGGEIVSMARAPGPIEPGQFEITVTVNARWDIQP